MNIEDLEFRKLTFQGLSTLLEWARNEGWNPGRKDAEVYWATDTDGFYGYFLKDTLIAGGAIVSYNGEFGFMGLFIVDPKYRALGIGRKLWFQRLNLLKSRLNPNTSIGMDGVVAMQPFYEAGGFKVSFNDERYEKIGTKFSIDSNISNIKEKDFGEIIQYDAKCFGFNRPQFLIPWMKLPDNINFQYIENNQLRGFCIVRKVNQGYKIGPLFADNALIAEELYKASLNAVIDELLYIDIPMINEAAIQLVKKYEAKYVFECARMYHGPVPTIDMNKVFGITTFELG